MDGTNTQLSADLEHKNRSGPNISPLRTRPFILAAALADELHHASSLLSVLEQHRFGSTKRAAFCSLPSVVDTVEMRRLTLLWLPAVMIPVRLCATAILERATKESNDDLANSD